MRKRTTLILAAVATMLLALVPAAGADEQYEFEFEPMVYDIAATPSGSILVGENAGAILGVDPGDMTVKEIRRGGVGVLTELDLPTVINGLDAIGRGNFFLTTGGSDIAQDGALWRVSPGSTRMVADLAAFERDNDPDAFEGPMWKDQRCEFIDGFSAARRTTRSMSPLSPDPLLSSPTPPGTHCSRQRPMASSTGSPSSLRQPTGTVNG
jgi:hypothetical protein